LEQCGALRRRLKPYRRLQLRFPGRLGTSFAEHESVVRAILDRNPTEAQTLLRSHVIVQGDRFADLIASIRQLGRRADDPLSKPDRPASPRIATTGE
jgi:DNA-binding GntR family transcriptional regulator